MLLTRIGNLDLHHTSFKRFAIEGQSLLQAIDIAKLDVSEPLGSLVLAILDDADVGDIAAAEEVGNTFGGRIVGQVSNVSGVWWLVRQSLRAGVTNRVS